MEPENRIENSTDGISHGNVYGTYIHGIFDKEKIVSEIVKSLAEKKGLSMEEVEGVDLKAFKESQYDLLADTLRKTSGHEGNLSDHGNAEIIFSELLCIRKEL